MQLDLAADDGTPVPGVRTPIRFANMDLALDRPSPRKGQDGA
jgi:crotonobetainyl-CoA:carnitine CoA-transferase CaiB-like acyl-CoA transferase